MATGTGSIKWLLLASVMTGLAVLLYFVGLVRKNKILKKPTDIPEEEEGNRIQAQKIYNRHTIVTAVMLVLAIVIFFVSKGTGA